MISIYFLSRSFSGEIVCFDDMESAGTAALDDDYVSIVAISERDTILPPLTYKAMETYASLQRASKKYTPKCMIPVTTTVQCCLAF